jgi:hypothetical protein
MQIGHAAGLQDRNFGSRLNVLVRSATSRYLHQTFVSPTSWHIRLLGV